MERNKIALNDIDMVSLEEGFLECFERTLRDNSLNIIYLFKKTGAWSGHVFRGGLGYSNSDLVVNGDFEIEDDDRSRLEAVVEELREREHSNLIDKIWSETISAAEVELGSEISQRVLREYFEGGRDMCSVSDLVEYCRD